MPKECSRNHWLHRRQQTATTWRTPGALRTYQWAPTPLASGTKPRPRAATREAGVPLKRHAPAQTRTPSPCRRTVRTDGTAPRENRTHKPRDDTQSDGNHKMSRNKSTFSDATSVPFSGDHLEAPKSEHDFATTRGPLMWRNLISKQRDQARS